MVVGNDSDGVANLWITPKLFASTIAIPLGSNLSISSAFNEQSSRNRELLVESSYISNTTSLHHIFVPLENGVLNVTFIYNGSSAQQDANKTITVVQPHKLYRFGTPCPFMCASLGVYRVRGSQYYTLCASSSGVCRCQLSQRIQQQHTATVLLNCRLLSHLTNTDIIVQRISDVLTFVPIRTQAHLLFTLNRHIYQDDVIDGTDINPITFSDNLNCQVVLRIQIIESKLLIYCANNTVAEYDFSNADLVPQTNHHLYFPCSATANFSVNVINNENADIHYSNYTMDDISHQPPPLRVRRFKLGECIMYEGHHLFLYTDLDNNLHLINSSMLTLRNLSTSNHCARPLITGERYVVTHTLENQTMSVLDLQDISSPLITQQDIMPFQLAAVISNLSVVVEIKPTPTSSYSTPAPSMSDVVTTVVITSSPIVEQQLAIGPTIGVVIAMFSFLVIISIIGLSIILWWCR